MYCPVSGNVCNRGRYFQWWSRRAINAEYSSRLYADVTSSFASVWVTSYYYRGYGGPLRCATDATAMPTKHPTGYNYFEFKYSIALEAAAAPSELAVTICLKVFARQSPAAKNPEAEVFPSSSALI